MNLPLPYPLNNNLGVFAINDDDGAGFDNKKSINQNDQLLT